MKKYLINPFEYFSESKLLIAGLSITLAGSFLAYAGTGRYDGVIDYHYSNSVLLYEPFADNVINICSLFLLLYFAGLFINKKSRAVDIFNAAIISRAPLYLLPLTGLWEYHRNIEDKLLEALKASPSMPVPDLTAAEYVTFTLVAIFGIFFIVQRL